MSASIPSPAPLPQALPAVLPEVRLWWCATTGDDAAFLAASALLSPAEHARAARFSMAALARRYVIGRAALRRVLGEVLAVPPGEVPIARGPRGRPLLAMSDAPDFNVSNTLQVALIGLCDRPGTRVGVDVEHGGRAVRHDRLAGKVCTPREQAALARLGDNDRRLLFLRLWTCKEAMSKATGDALAAPMRRLDVELAPHARLADGPLPYVPADWSLAAAPVPSAYVATVALWRVPAGDERRTR